MKCKAGAKTAACKKAKKVIKDDEDEAKTPAKKAIKDDEDMVKTPAKAKKAIKDDEDEVKTPPKKRSSARRRCNRRAYHSTETMLKDVPDVDIKEIAK